MEIRFRIVEVHAAEHQIVVRFWSDEVPEAELATEVDAVTGEVLRARTDIALDLPLPVPEGEGLRLLILRAAPAEWLATRGALKAAPVDLAAVAALLGVEHAADAGEVDRARSVRMVRRSAATVQTTPVVTL